MEGGQSGECTENDQNTVSLPAVDKNAAHLRINRQKNLYIAGQIWYNDRISSHYPLHGAFGARLLAVKTATANMCKYIILLLAI